MFDGPGRELLTDARQLISPLISLLSQLHNMGLTHCGISPQNIYVDSRKRVILDGFALPELRTVGNGLHAELYAGYSAPEQYSKALWQGEWTDIYSLGAVLYMLKWPNLSERRGFHELFHLFILAGSACHFAAVFFFVA